MIELKNALVDKSVISDVVNNIKNNYIIQGYYTRFSKENSVAFPNDMLVKKLDRISFCNKFWALDKYDLAKVKDFKKTNLCRDKFCSNCKKVKQAARMARYIPEISKYKDSLYHLVLTVPNVPGIDLRITIKKMISTFKKLILYINGSKSIKGYDFSSWGYEGAIRSLEVTFKGDSYHPHFHVALSLPGLKLDKKYIETLYSFSYGKLSNKFSIEELLIQKLWYLLYNDKSITFSNINKLKHGYSCFITKFKESDYAELFKYISKNSDEQGNLLTYENFVCLYYSLYNVKQIQGYGVFYNIKDIDDVDVLQHEYDILISALKEKEAPSVIYERPEALLSDTNYMLISRKSYFKYLNKLV